MALGFTVAPDARHPFGTGNCCVFFENLTYLEPIAILDRSAADMAAAEGVTFVKRLKRFSERQGEGLAMLALASEDAEADRARFQTLGRDGGPVYRFSRPATLADGSERAIGVVTAFPDLPQPLDATLFACQHVAKDVLFQPSRLQHANGARGVSALVAVAEDPRSFASLLSDICETETEETEAGLTIPLAGARILLQRSEQFSALYGIPAPSPRRGLLFAAFELDVLDLQRVAGYAGREAKHEGGRVIVPPAPGLGAALVFRSVADD